MGKRLVRSGAVAVVAAALVWAGGSEAQNRTINVYNWSDYIAPDAIQKFTAETGLKVNYDVYDTNEVLEAKLTAGKSGYDIVVPTQSPFFARQIPAGFYQKLDKSKLKNLGNLDPEILAIVAKFDPGNEYGVPWMWGTVGLGYNVDKIKKAVPSAPVDSLALLFDPAVVEKFKGCGVMVLDSPVEVFAAALAYLGLNPDSKDLGDLEKATQVLLKVRPFIRKFQSSEYINDLANGDACLAFGYSGDVEQAAARAEEAKNGMKIAYSIPKQGAEISVDVLAIPKDAPSPDLALQFIDYLLRPEVVAATTNAIGYPNGNKASLPLLKPEIRDNPSIYPPAEIRAKLYTISQSSRDFDRARTRAWTKVKTGR